MEELKTLKDIEMHWIKLFSEGDPRPREVFNGLRQEAIKWIKALSDEETKYQNKEIENFLGCGCCDSEQLVIKFLKHFGNITEEDLKNGN